MDMFTRFNRKKIQDRQIDTLIGLSKGLIADGKVNQSEADFLYTWLIQNATIIKNPIIQNLLNRVDAMLDDNNLDAEEAKELFFLLKKISGEESIIGEVAKPSSLPLNNPAPKMKFEGNLFLCTGTFAFGTRNECNNAIELLGGKIGTNITKKLNYLVIGSYVTDTWIHETFGRKIEKAIAYQDDGTPIKIVSEEHWANEAGL